MKTYLKGSIPGEAQAAGGEGMRSHAVSCHTETLGSREGALASPAAASSCSPGARRGAASAVTLDTPMSHHGRVSHPCQSWIWLTLCQSGLGTPSTGAGEAQALQDKAAVDAGMHQGCEQGVPPHPGPAHQHEPSTLGKGGK